MIKNFEGTPYDCSVGDKLTHPQKPEIAEKRKKVCSFFWTPQLEKSETIWIELNKKAEYCQSIPPPPKETQSLEAAAPTP